MFVYLHIGVIIIDQAAIALRKNQTPYNGRQMQIKPVNNAAYSYMPVSAAQINWPKNIKGLTPPRHSNNKSCTFRLHGNYVKIFRQQCDARTAHR